MAPDDSAEFRRAEPADAPAIVAALVRSEGAPTSIPGSTTRRRWLPHCNGDDFVPGSPSTAPPALCCRTSRSPSADRRDLVADAPRSRLVEFGHAFTRPESRGLGLASRLGALTIGWAIANDVGGSTPGRPRCVPTASSGCWRRAPRRWPAAGDDPARRGSRLPPRRRRTGGGAAVRAAAGPDARGRHLVDPTAASEHGRTG